MMIDSSQSKLYTLSIRLSTDGFSFSIHNPLQTEEEVEVIEKEVNASLSITANLKVAFHELDFLNFTYQQVNILIAGKRFTTVPMELFEGEEEEAERLFYHNHPTQENETVMYNVLKRSNIVVIFGVDSSVHALLCEQYSNACFYAQVTPLIEYCTVKSRLDNNKKMYAFVQKERTGIFCFERGRLLLVNSFDCACTADRLYYLLYVWKQLNLEQESDELYLAGLLPDKDELVGELKRFIRQVSVQAPATNIDMQALRICE